MPGSDEATAYEQLLRRRLHVEAPPATAAPAVAGETVQRIVRALGLTEPEHAPHRAVVEQILADRRAAGVEPGALFALAQAYGRGTGRIAAASVEVVRRIMRDTPPERRLAVLEGLLSFAVPLAGEMFTTVYAARLGEAFRDALADAHLEEPDAAERAVALVDIVASTRLMLRATPRQMTAAVDALYESALAGTRGEGVSVVKFVGDGVYLLGRDAWQVTLAAADIVRRLDGMLPTGVRAGLSRGPVIERAGDYFGLPVNVATRLVAEAERRTVLVERSALAAELVPDGTPSRSYGVRGLPAPVECWLLDAHALP